MRHLAIATALLFALPAAFAAPIDYVPMDTPYLVASLAPMPPAAAERAKLYGSQIVEMFKSGAKQGFLKGLSAGEPETKDAAAKRAEAEQLLSIFAELGEIYTSDEAALKAGFKPQALFALYGVGLVPVMRLEISDAAKARVTIANTLNKIVDFDQKTNARLAEKKRGPKFSFTRSALRTGEIFRIGTEKIQPIIVIEGDQLVISVLPLDAKADLLQMVAPATAGSAKALSAKLGVIQQHYGLNGYALGFVEFAPMANMFMGKPNKLESALWAAAHDEKLPMPSAVCKSEMLGIIDHMPRAVMGYTVMSGTEMTAKGVLELAPDIAAQLAGTVVPMPAYGNGTAFKMAFSTDPLKAMNVMRVQANNIIAKPYACPELLSWNESAAKVKENLANPMLGMVAMVKGFGLSFDDFKMDFTAEKPEPRGISGNVALFTDQPEAVLGMVQGYMTQLANTKPELGGKPVKLDPSFFATVPAGSLSVNEGYAAMNPAMLIIGVGKNRLAELSALQNAPSTKNGEAFELSYGSAFLELALGSMEKAKAGMPAADQEGFAQMMAIQKKMMAQMESVGSTMAFTKNGVELISTTRFKK